MKLSIIDSKDSDITKILPQEMDFIDKNIKSNIKSNNQILVHCSGGINRSPIVVISYLVLHRGYELQDAIKLVKEKKPSIRIQNHYLSQLILFLKKPV